MDKGNVRKRNNGKRAVRADEAKILGAKLRVLTAGFILGIFFLAGKVFLIQAEDGAEYEKRAIVQQVNRNYTSRTINANRGPILDRNRDSQAFAVSDVVYNIFIDCKLLLSESFAVQSVTVDKVNKILGTPKDELWRYLSEEPENQYKVLVRKADAETKRKLEEELAKPVAVTADGTPVDTGESAYVGEGAESPEASYAEISAADSAASPDTEETADDTEETADGSKETAVKAKHVYFETDTKRRYPMANLASSVIGMIRGETYSGLEAQYNTELTGVEGREFNVYDENNNAVSERVDPVEGGAVITTLDMALQQKAQEIAARYGEAALAENAALIVMDPDTGELLTVAEYPSFDLNDPANIDKINSEYHRERIKALPEEERMDEIYKLWSSFSISYTYEPGSIFKPLVVAAALEEGIINENETFYCGGFKEMPNADPIPCNNVHGHGQLTYKEIIAKSCNVGIMHIAERLGRERYYDYQKDFGIGSYSGIDSNSEPDTEGLVHTLSTLNYVELCASSMGQGLNTTPIQMMAAFSSIINGGDLMKPHLVSQITDAGGKVVKSFEPEVLRKVLSRETSDIMKKTMIATMEQGGTGAKAAVAGYSIGGKTGTGQQGVKVGDGSEDLVLSFMCYFPADDPEYIVLSVINRSANFVEGNSQTLPMAKEMVDFIIKQKHIPADNNEAVTLEETADSITVDDYTGRKIADVTGSLNYNGLLYDLSGSGSTVKNQFPAGGTKVARGSKIFITLTQEDSSETLFMVPDVNGMTVMQAEETIEAASLVPVIKGAGLETQGQAEEGGEDAAPESPPADAEGVEVSVKTAANQLPKPGIKVGEGTEVIVFIE